MVCVPKLVVCTHDTENPCDLCSHIVFAVPKPSRLERLGSIPNELVHSNQSNGNLTPSTKVPLLPPGSLARSISAQNGSVRSEGESIPPPKPPRTGSTSPSVFLHMEDDLGGQEEEEEGADDVYEEEEEDISESSNGENLYFTACTFFHVSWCDFVHKTLLPVSRDHLYIRTTCPNTVEPRLSGHLCPLHLSRQSG